MIIIFKTDYYWNSLFLYETQMKHYTICIIQFKNTFDKVGFCSREAFCAAKQDGTLSSAVKGKTGESVWDPVIIGSGYSLVRFAYQAEPSEVKKTLVKDSFIDALANSDMRLHIKQSRLEIWMTQASRFAHYWRWWRRSTSTNTANGFNEGNAD